MDDSTKSHEDLLKKLRELRKEIEAGKKSLSRAERTVERLRKRNRSLSKALTKHQDAQQQVIQRERLHALGQMASGIVHDFNNALTPILGASDFLLTNPKMLDNKAETLTLLESTRTAARDARDMVRRLKNFYKAEDPADVKPVDINPLVEQVILLTEPKWGKEATARGIKIEIDKQLKKVPAVCVSDSHLREVLMNLVLNAVDSMADGGTLTICTRKKKGCVIVEVADTGEGMTDDVKQRCFEPFFSTKGNDGTGMGLAMAYGVIKSHDGDISVESALGKGTSIIISIPAAGEAASVIEEDLPACDPVSGLRVLVVDDDKGSQGIIMRYLNADGHKVDVASTSNDAMKLSADGEYDLIMINRTMPKINGSHLAASIKGIVPAVPMIMLTGNSEFAEAEGRLDGVDVVLDKPVTQGELRNAIVQMVDR